MGIHVFIGPTLARREVTAIVPHARLHPPVKHGDLVRGGFAVGDLVVLVDGYFHQVGAVRHKEILELLANGVRVVGCASMGALRAVELSVFGMVGCGTVYDMYRRGVIDGDGEVAVAHGEEPEYRSFGIALVNIRHAAAGAVRLGVLSDDGARRAVDCARRIHYVHRSWRAVEIAAREAGPDSEAAVDALRRFAAAHPEYADVKAADVVETLTSLDRLSFDDSWRRRDGDSPLWRTRHLQDWHALFRGVDVDGTRVTDGQATRYRQLYDAAFPAAWRAHVLSRIAGLPPDADPQELTRGAVAAARERGFTFYALPASRTGMWLSRAEYGRLGPDEALAAILVRSHRPPGHSMLAELVTALGGPAALRRDATHRVTARRVAAAEFAAAHQRHQAPGPDATALAEHLVAAWTLDRDDDLTLRLAALDRGFRSVAEAVGAAATFQGEGI